MKYVINISISCQADDTGKNKVKYLDRGHALYSVPANYNFFTRNSQWRLDLPKQFRIVVFEEK